MLAARTVMMGGLYYFLNQAPVYDGGNTIFRLIHRTPWNQLIANPNDWIVWGVGLCVLLVTIWFLPRLILAGAATVVLVPRSLRGRLGAALAQVYPRWPFGVAATFVAFAGAFVAWYSPVLDENFTPLQPVLRSNFWLTIHVLTIVSSYGAGALAWGLGNLALAYYLFGTYWPIPIGKAGEEEISLGSMPRLSAPQALFARLARDEDGSLPGAPIAASEPIARRLLGSRPPAACAALAAYCYKAMQVAVLLLAAGTILGGLWADVSWGRFWGWDPKEVFALVSLLVYLAVLHGRYAGLFGDFGTVAGTILGGSAIIFSWYGVNFVLGVGLHSYGFGAGGQAEVGTAVLLNWIFLGAAALRYWYETRV
jgi:ABC-type transport system involved in cytochrome c biogenesis permease subunit